jgi:predicted enzyme related to lactoylglutathione lyase
VILYADDIDAAEASVRRAGGEVVAPQFDFPGGRRFHFREPGGNVLAVWSKREE